MRDILWRRNSFVLACCTLSILLAVACTPRPDKSLDEFLSEWNNQVKTGRLLDAEKTALEMLEAADYFKGKQSIA